MDMKQLTLGICPLFNSRLFKKFQHDHEDAVAILFATGPSLNDFSYSGLPELPSVRVGVNSFIYHDQYELDYYFCGHDVSKEGPDHPHSGIEKVDPIREKIKSRSSDMQVFCACAGLRRDSLSGEIQQHEHETFFSAEARREFNAIPYVVSWFGKGREVFATSLEYQPLYNHSIAFPALQFLLYTGVGKIYLVGCDCGGGASYLTSDVPWMTANTLTIGNFTKGRDVVWHWREFAEFKNVMYPDVEIISVNPHGLKGMFEECDTRGG